MKSIFGNETSSQNRKYRQRPVHDSRQSAASVLCSAHSSPPLIGVSEVAFGAIDLEAPSLLLRLTILTGNKIADRFF